MDYICSQSFIFFSEWHWDVSLVGREVIQQRLECTSRWKCAAVAVTKFQINPIVWVCDLVKGPPLRKVKQGLGRQAHLKLHCSKGSCNYPFIEVMSLSFWELLPHSTFSWRPQPHCFTDQPAPWITQHNVCLSSSSISSRPACLRLWTSFTPCFLACGCLHSSWLTALQVEFLILSPSLGNWWGL